jgi:nitroreductase
MVRTYDPQRAVPGDLLVEFLELATRAPSAGFSQGWDFVVLRTAADTARFWSVSAPSGGAEPGGGPDRWLLGLQTAPVLILCLSDRERYLDRYAEPDKGWTDRDPARWPVPYWDVDTGMAGLLVLLGAVDAGLAGCFFGVPPARQDAVLAEFAIPADRRVVGVISLGHPAPGGADRRSPSLRRGRRPVREIAHDGNFGVPLSATGPELTAGPETRRVKDDSTGSGDDQADHPDDRGDQAGAEFDQHAEADRGHGLTGRGPGFGAGAEPGELGQIDAEDEADGQSQDRNDEETDYS